MAEYDALGKSTYESTRRDDLAIDPDAFCANRYQIFRPRHRIFFTFEPF